ncbi:MAG TPA: HIRAN domain-containing protein [Gaiellaceae bacterium]
MGLRLYLEERAWATEIEGGEELGGYGYGLRDEEGRALGWDDPALVENGVEVLEVAGTSFRLPALQDRAFAPGSRLLLRPDPENAYDENAVEVLDAGGRVQVGFVRKERSEALARRLQSEQLEVFSLWAWRNERGQRSALRVLVAPPGTVAGEPRPLV